MGVFNLSLGNLAISIFLGLIGAALLLYGRKEIRVPHIVAGVILVVFPYFVGIWWLAVLIAVIVLTGLSVITRLGY
jgi:hypothetical protein